ncbi:MAG: SCO family protein [Ignavibacteria bacterium]|jgi:protein SCO1/2
MKKIIFILILVLLPIVIRAGEENKSPVGIDEKLGQYVPGDITLFDETGKPIKFSEATNGKPVILTLVYYRCPGICSPLLTELTHIVDKLDLIIGKDYNIVTVSFNTAEDYIMAAEKKKNYYGLIKIKKPGENDWRFLTADSINVARITDAVGFRYIKQGNDFVHAGALTMLSPDLKITRYLYGSEFLTFDVKMGLIEAAEGKIGSPISKITKLCFSYDAEGKKYVLNLTRIVGSGILFVLVVFAVILVATKKKKKSTPNNKEV